MKMKLGLASNFEDEVLNIKPIWDIFKDVVDMWTVVDSGSTDGTIEKLREVVGDKLNLIESKMIRIDGYGYSRTKLIELSEGMDWVLIIDGDERMWREDAKRIRSVIDECEKNPDEEILLIALPRCHYQDWEETKVEYGSMENVGSNWREALNINPDWQPRLLKRVMLPDGKSKIQFYRRVHEIVDRRPDVKIGISMNIDNPVIRHFGWMKSNERKSQIANLCQGLWEKDKENKEIWDTYEKERAAGVAMINYKEYLDK